MIVNEEEKKKFIGKKIKDIKIDGYGIELLLDDGIKLIYEATDCGFSDWLIKKEDNL